MTGPSALSQLLAECDQRCIRLHPADGGRLTIDAPPGALTPDLLQRLKGQKADLLKMLTGICGEAVDRGEPRNVRRGCEIRDKWGFPLPVASGSWTGPWG
ncbi:MAG: hypothetical protein WD894_11935 [Pirellulales bacterium]